MKSLVTSLILMTSAIKNKKILKTRDFFKMSITFEPKGILKFLLFF